MDGRARISCPGALVVFFFYYFFGLVGGPTSTGRYLIFVSREVSRRMHSKPGLGALGARVMSIIVKTNIFVKVELGDNHG